MDIEKVIIELMAGVVPERKAEFSQLLENYSPHFHLSDDRPGFFLEAGAFGIVQFTHRTMLKLALLGHASKLGLHCYAGLLVILNTQNEPLRRSELEAIPGQAEAQNLYNQCIEAIYELSAIERLDDFTWPEWAPSPYTGRPTDNEDALAYDLSLIATAYTFLHEIQHVKFSGGECERPQQVEEEKKCDEFARMYITEKIDIYAKQSGWPAEKIFQKRGMGIVLASILLFVITPPESRVGGDSHPSVSSRLVDNQITGYVDENSNYWLYTASLLASQLAYEGSLPDEMSFNSYCDLARKLANHV